MKSYTGYNNRKKRKKRETTQPTQARGTRVGCRRAARVTPRRAVAGFGTGIRTGPASRLPVVTTHEFH